MKCKDCIHLEENKIDGTIDYKCLRIWNVRIYDKDYEHKCPIFDAKVNDVDTSQDKALNLAGVSGSALDFYTDLMKLINAYCDKGLKKPDLVHKMEYATESCKLS